MFLRSTSKWKWLRNVPGCEQQVRKVIRPFRRRHQQHPVSEERPALHHERHVWHLLVVQEVNIWGQRGTCNLQVFARWTGRYRTGVIRYLAVWTEWRPRAGWEEPESSRNTERTQTPAASLPRSPAEEKQQEVQTAGTSWLELQHRFWWFSCTLLVSSMLNMSGTPVESSSGL